MMKEDVGTLGTYGLDAQLVVTSNGHYEKNGHGIVVLVNLMVKMKHSSME